MSVYITWGFQKQLSELRCPVLTNGPIQFNDIQCTIWPLMLAELDSVLTAIAMFLIYPAETQTLCTL